MWIKKSNKRIKEENIEFKTNLDKNRFRLALKTSIWAFIIVFFLSILISLTLGIDYSNIAPTPPNVLKISEIPDYLPTFLNNAIIAAIVLFIVRMVYPSIFKEKNISLMCDKCFQTKARANDMNCTCGGTYYPIKNYEWVKEEPNIITNDNWLDEFRVNKIDK